MLNSVFTLRAYMPAVLLLIMASFIVMMIYLTLAIPADESGATIAYAIMSLVILVFLLLIVWVLFEMRKKAMKLQFSDMKLTVSGYYGNGPSIQFNFSELDGYFTSQFPSSAGSYEYLFLLKNKQKVVTLSEYYHRNYDEMKQFITQRLRFKGDRPYSMTGEISEMLD